MICRRRWSEALAIACVAGAVLGTGMIALVPMLSSFQPLVILAGPIIGGLVAGMLVASPRRRAALSCALGMSIFMAVATAIAPVKPSAGRDWIPYLFLLVYAAGAGAAVASIATKCRGSSTGEAVTRPRMPDINDTADMPPGKGAPQGRMGSPARGQSVGSAPNDCTEANRE